MRDMRRLAEIYLKVTEIRTEKTQVHNIRDLFRRKNLTLVLNAIDLVTQVNGELQLGKKTGLKYLIINAAKILKIISLCNNNDNSANDIVKFIDLLNNTESNFFGDAVYKLNCKK